MIVSVLLLVVGLAGFALGGMMFGDTRQLSLATDPLKQ